MAEIISNPSQQPGNQRKRRQQQAFSLDVKQIFNLLISRWYWFVISLAIALGIALLYLARTEPVYEANATILLINESSKKGSVDLSPLGIKEPKDNATNEIMKLRSLVLMTKVVNALGLNNRYYAKEGLRMAELYKSSPVIVIPADTLSREYYSFKIQLDGKKNFVLSDFDGNKESKKVKGTLGQTVKTPVGLFTIAPSASYNGRYTKSQITYVHTPANATGAQFAGKVAASQPTETKSSIINIRVSDVSRQRAIDLLEALIAAYEEQGKSDQAQVAISTNEFINKRLAILEEDLGNVDTDISSFKASTRMPDVMSSSALYFGRSFQNESEFLKVNSALAMADFVRRELTTQGLETTLPNNLGIESPAIQNQISEYNNLVLQRNRLNTPGNEQNPALLDVTATLNTMKHNMVRSLDNYIRTLRTQLGNLNSTQSKASRELSANPNREKYLLSIERQQKVKEQLYLFLLQKREESELTQAYIKSNMTLISAPTGGGSPIFPKRGNVLLMALAAGLIAPIVIFFIYETLNTSIRGRKDIVNLSLPFVGEIPYGPGKRRKLPVVRRLHAAGKGDVIVKEGANNVINEAFRAIRTSLVFMTPDNKGEGRLISFTSACSGSGKTFITMNLAVALALSGKKVCVVDLDMRKASLSKWGAHTDRGISNYLIGQTTPEEIIMHNVAGYENVDLVPVGILPPNPVELLSHKRVKEFLEWMRSRYDYVLIDCPPAEIVSDARIISNYVDMTIFIIRAGMVDRTIIDDLEEYAETGRYPNLAIILNGTDPNSMYNRKRYGYGYGYGYGYVRKK